jgi:bifunctional N-acetylglucosamine-1-phosphate-uridyltransferase/glucosamine-1-phosphate-acetyltransferase GlmU-like protein
MTRLTIVLAPGPGPAIQSRLPECLHPVLGDPCLLWVLRTLPTEALVLAAHPAVGQAVADWAREGLLPFPVTCEVHAGPSGTALLRSALPALDARGPGEVLLLEGDAPLLPEGILERFQPWARLRAALASGGEVGLPEAHRLITREDQAALEAEARLRIQWDWMAKGVTFLDPDAVVGPRVVLSRDVEIGAGVRLEGSLRVGEGTRIGQGCVLRDCGVGRNVELRPYCVARGARLGDGVKVGPFAHLREGTILEDEVHVGNFVETKKAHLHTGAKANHLTYLGDVEVGERSNIGAGCITCNYDGVSKHRTVIGREVFVGSDCQLVAPLSLGDGCLIGAGTTVTQDVPADALALSRTPLTIREGAAQRLRLRLRSNSR